MQTKQPDNIICPSCGNVNPFALEQCLKCGLPLTAVRELLTTVRDAVAPSSTTPAQEASHPAPPLPDLSMRSGEKLPWKYIDGKRILIRGMGDRAIEIAGWLYDIVEERQIERVKRSVGSLTYHLDDGKSDSRDYYFLERDLGEEAMATMAVHIAPKGKDLFIEWEHYETPPTHEISNGCVGWIVGIVIYIILVFIGIVTKDTATIVIMILAIGPLVAGISGAAAGNANKNKERMLSLIGFQNQESSAFRMAVRDALNEAIDKAGISKALIQGLPKDEDSDRRVI